MESVGKGVEAKEHAEKEQEAAKERMEAERQKKR